MTWLLFIKNISLLEANLLSVFQNNFEVDNKNFVSTNSDARVLSDSELELSSETVSRIDFDIEIDYVLNNILKPQEDELLVGTGQQLTEEKRAKQEIAYLVALNLEKSKDAIDKTIRSLMELKELAETCGAIVLGADYQNLHAVNARTYIGSGKLKEIAEYAKSLGCDTLIFDDPISGSQIRNIQEETKMRVLDRTLIILDIFARRASTKEGKLQVELAQYSYRLSRVSLINEELSRLGGGIGTRGPGETQLEIDRRHIRNRINVLRKELQDVDSRRVKQREKRNEQGQTIVALVGYTNAGKSTVINKLTDSDLFAMDQVFATLDSAFRDLRLPDGSHVMLTDTVGFIRKLPHELVKAFNSTLNEVSNADLVLQVLDVSDPEAEYMLEVVDAELLRLKAADKPRILMLNKIDLASEEQLEAFSHMKETDKFRVMPVSALTGEGLEEVLDIVAEFLAYRQRNYYLDLDYSESSLYAYIKKHGNLLHEEFGDSINLEFTMDVRLSGPVERYLKEKFPERYVDEEDLF